MKYRENFQNEEHESKYEQLDSLGIENSENSDEDDFIEERPPPDQPSTSELPGTQKNIIECRD